MIKPAPKGFTLIELLIVIAMMAVIGTFVLANYRSFGEDQNLKNAALDIQSLLRTAQTNATTALKCPETVDNSCPIGGQTPDLGVACTSCIWDKRPDLDPFYSQLWSYCSTKKKVNNWCNAVSAQATAECNALRNGDCSGACSGSNWSAQVKTDSNSVVSAVLNCSSANAVKTATLDSHVVIDSISGSGSSCPTTAPFTISFALLSGKMTIASANCTSLNVKLKNTKTQSTKSVKIDTGGRIYVE